MIDPEGCSVRPEHILMVDDEPMILETFSALLSDSGYCVSTATTLHDAMAQVSREKFDIVIMDHYLGNDRGIDSIEVIRQIDPGLYFVVITAHNNSELAVKSLKNGATDFIGKPFRLRDLLKSIDYVKKRRGLDIQRTKLVTDLEQQVDEKVTELEDVYFSVMTSLAQAVEKKDTGTYGHSRRVSHYCKLIATAFCMGEKESHELVAASLLHDIGKIGISDFILGKPVSLTEDEREIVRSHPQKGVEILKPIKKFSCLLPAIMHHHESYDGRGYPYGLKGEDIPLHARIITVADTYDAIISNRPYRSGAKYSKAMEEITIFSGIQFDPEVVAAFASISEKYLHPDRFLENTKTGV